MGEHRPVKRELDDIGSFLTRRTCLSLIIRDILDEKGREVVTISPDAPLREALELMPRRDVGALVVVEEERVVGILSERDFAREEVFGKRNWEDNPVRRLMSAPVQAVSPGDSVLECMSLMTMGRIRHLPVCDGQRLEGLVSIGDLVKSFIADRERLIGQYNEYITGGE